MQLSSLGNSAASLALVLTDPTAEDNPIVYVNSGFERTTGYARASAVGRNCRFLQGDATERDRIDALRDALAQGQPFMTEITNVRSCGRPFRNTLAVVPVRGDADDVELFVGLQAGSPCDAVDEERARVIRARLQALQDAAVMRLSPIVRTLRAAAGRGDARRMTEVIGHRAEALGLLYDRMGAHIGPSDDALVPLDSYLSKVAAALQLHEDAPGATVNVNLDAVDGTAGEASLLGVVLSELLSNALRHGCAGRGRGQVLVSFTRTPEGLVLSVGDDGLGMPDRAWPEGGDGLGARILASLGDDIGFRPRVETGRDGTLVTVTLPFGERAMKSVQAVA